MADNDGAVIQDQDDQNLDNGQNIDQNLNQDPPTPDDESDKTPGDGDPDTPPDESPAPGDTPEETGKSKRYYRKQISKLARENEQMRQDLEALKSRIPPEPDAPKEPKREDFENQEDYLEARVDYLADKKIREREEKSKADAEKRQGEDHQSTLLEGWEEKKDDARERYPDFDEVLDDSENVPGPMASAILESDIGADVAYYLSKHPKELNRIAKLSPTRQVAEIGKLEPKVQSVIDKQKETKPSGAPPPVKPVKGGGGKDNEPSAKDSTEDWMQKRQQKVHGKK